MTTSLRLNVVALIGMLCLVPSAALAAPRGMTLFEVRDQFSRCGYEIANPRADSRYVVLQDPGASSIPGADYRIVMAIVYTSTDAAVDARRKAQAAAADQAWPDTDDAGPRLLSGYGASVWRANVALVQTRYRTLSHMYVEDAETGEAKLASPDEFDLYAPRVDRDFVACLESGVLALDGAPVPASDVAPVFMPGRPW